MLYFALYLLFFLVDLVDFSVSYSRDKKSFKEGYSKM